MQLLTIVQILEYSNCSTFYQKINYFDICLPIISCGTLLIFYFMLILCSFFKIPQLGGELSKQKMNPHKKRNHDINLVYWLGLNPFQWIHHLQCTHTQT